MKYVDSIIYSTERQQDTIRSKETHDRASIQFSLVHTCTNSGSFGLMITILLANVMTSRTCCYVTNITKMLKSTVSSLNVSVHLFLIEYITNICLFVTHC
jgi:hypothetical protein